MICVCRIPIGTKQLSAATHQYMMEADLTKQTSKPYQHSAKDWRPDWSPDGTKIVFVSNRSGKYDIYAMNPDGSGQTNRTGSAAR